MTVTVVRVDTKVSETERAMPFSIVKKEDPTLEAGKEKLVQTGKEGLVVEQYREAVRGRRSYFEEDGQQGCRDSCS